MPFTVEDVLTGALVLNRKTQEDAKVSGGGLEIVRAVNRSLGGIFRIGARVNPGYHGATDAVAPTGDAWTRPADAELVTLIRNAAGDRVFVSHPEDPVPDPEELFLIRWGRVYRRPAGLVEPTGELTFYYSRRPAAAAALADEVDLEDAFRALLEFDLGAWFAHRDERWDELGVLWQERDRELGLYLASLEHESVGDVRNVGQTGTFDSPSLIDLKHLLLSPASTPGG